MHRPRHFVICRLIVAGATFFFLPSLRAAEPPASTKQADSEKSSASGKPSDSAVLKIVDEVGKTHSVSADDIAKLPRRKIKTKSHETEMEFEGVLLVDLLKSAGVLFGDNLKGKRAAAVAVCEAADGYRVPLALLEFDPDTTDKQALVADRRDGKPLDEKEGPLRLVIPDEKRPIRWIRMLRTIRIVNLKDLPLGDGENAKAGAEKSAAEVKDKSPTK